MKHSLPFSVAMCVYGGDNAEHFRQAVKSVLNQTVPPSEIVIVVDGPVPQTIDDVLLEYAQSPLFQIVRLEKNQGHGEARRVSLAHCTHEIVALMDADDISLPQRFEKQIQFFAGHDGLSIVGGYIAEVIDTPDNIVGKRIVPCEDKEIKEYLKRRCPMNQVTVMFRKKDVEQVGGYIDWYCEEDYYLWIRMYQAGLVFANVPETLVYVRVGKEMYQRRGGMKYFVSEARLQTYMLHRKIIKFPTYFANVSKRLIVQVLLPNKMRGWVFRHFARS